MAAKFQSRRRDHDPPPNISHRTSGGDVPNEGGGVNTSQYYDDPPPPYTRLPQDVSQSAQAGPSNQLLPWSFHHLDPSQPEKVNIFPYHPKPSKPGKVTLPLNLLLHIFQYFIEGPEATKVESIIQLAGVCQDWSNLITLNWRSCKDCFCSATVTINQSMVVPLGNKLELKDREHPLFSQKTSIKLTQFEMSNLMETFPDFPNSWPNLHSLEMEPLNPIFQSNDLFKSFPPTLECLSLYNIPLYESVLNVKTLTKFALTNWTICYPLDILLKFLEGNHSLKHVKLHIEIQGFFKSEKIVPIKNQLQSLIVRYHNVEDARALISNIPLQRGGNLKIISCDWDSGLNDILPEIHTMHSKNLLSPTYMHHWLGNHIKTSGPGGSFEFFGLSKLEEENLTGLSLLSFENIQELHLQPFQFRVPNFSHFPALKHLIVEYNEQEFSTLFASLQPPKPVSLQSLGFASLEKLGFWLSRCSEEFMEELATFVTNHQITAPGRLNCVVIICRKEDQLPSSHLVYKLKERVSIKLEVLDQFELPRNLFFDMRKNVGG